MFDFLWENVEFLFFKKKIFFGGAIFSNLGILFGNLLIFC